MCMNIENDKNNFNAQISHMEETVGLKWYISRVFKYTLDLFCIQTCDYQSVAIAGGIFRKTFHVVSNISW